MDTPKLPSDFDLLPDMYADDYFPNGEVDKVGPACATRPPATAPRPAAAFIASRRAQGVSFRQLAGELNALGFTAPRGGTFN